MALKTNKSLTKRLKITRTGKLIARRPGHNHFNSRDDARASLAKRGKHAITIPHKTQSRFLPGVATNVRVRVAKKN